MNDCFICLRGTERQQTDLRCSCKIYVHSTCWNLYKDYKGWEECPYCHTITIPHYIEEHRGLKTQIKIIKIIIICILIYLIIMSFVYKSIELDELP